MEHVSEHNRARLVTTEGSTARSELLQTHGATGASVLISPSLYQGVDLKDDLARFQVIVKVPYPDLSDRRTRVKMQRDRGWYDWQTALRLVQTYGRSVRSETDQRGHLRARLELPQLREGAPGALPGVLPGGAVRARDIARRWYPSIKIGESPAEAQ